MDAGGAERTLSVDERADLEFEVKAGEVAIYPKAGVRFYVIQFKYTKPAATPQEWDFSSAAWQSALEAGAASAKGSNQANWTVSVDGLTYTSGSKNGKWDASGYIQPNGSGSTTERVFTSPQCRGRGCRRGRKDPERRCPSRVDLRDPGGRRGHLSEGGHPFLQNRF